ncbi:MAG: hypothetical protein WCE42_06340, partial [Rhizobium ruizarguesonis]
LDGTEMFGNIAELKNRHQPPRLPKPAGHPSLRTLLVFEARLRRVRLSNILPGKTIGSIYAKPCDSVNSLSRPLTLLSQKSVLSDKYHLTRVAPGY